MLLPLLYALLLPFVIRDLLLDNELSGLLSKRADLEPYNVLSVLGLPLVVLDYLLLLSMFSLYFLSYSSFLVSMKKLFGSGAIYYFLFIILVLFSLVVLQAAYLMILLFYFFSGDPYTCAQFITSYRSLYTIVFQPF